VTTDDGYILSVFRVTSPDMKPGAHPIFLQHGLFSDSTTWVLNKEFSLAFVLAKAGFDVWMGNNRGCLYSRSNTHLDPVKDFTKFFDYSFFELAKYDVPANVDYVRKRTGKAKITYIGHSQGTSQMFAALSEKFGQLDQKVDTFIALAPIVNLKSTTNSFL